jgi:hypothetical protein
MASTAAVSVMATLPFPVQIVSKESIVPTCFQPTEKGQRYSNGNFLTKRQAKRMNDLLTNAERDAGYQVCVLCQAYPNTPGLAIFDYWNLGNVKS